MQRHHFRVHIQELDEWVLIGHDTQILDFMRMLNHLRISWSMQGGKPTGLTIITSGKAGITFDLQDGEIYQVTKRLDI